jgi:enediyne biosynthesis protein E4
MANVTIVRDSRIHRSPAFLLALLLAASVAGCRPAAVPAASPVAARLPPAPVRFTDVTEAAGIRFLLGHEGRSPLTIRDTIGTGAAFLDYDGDGWCDLFLVGQVGTRSKGVCALYHNERNGTFRDVTAGSGLTRPGFWTGCATGDLDNDGRVDLLVTGDDCLALYHNEGGGHFRDVAARMGLAARGWATSAGFADLDGDGRLDLYVGRYLKFGPGTPDLCTYRGIQAACPPTHYDPQFGTLYRNAGDRFIDVTRAAGLDDAHGKTLGVAFADYDNDGRTDFYLANDGVPGDMYHQEGRFHFRNVALEAGTGYNTLGGEQAGMGTDFGDYDGNGRLDLIVTTFQREPDSLYHNEGGGQFAEQGYAAGLGAATVNTLGFGVKFADLDNDGWLDVPIANGHVQDTIARIQPQIQYPQRMQLFINHRDGTFQEMDGGPPFARPIVGRALATADWDHDGDVDLLVTDLEGSPLLLRNEGPHTTSHWLGVALAGTQSNRTGLGARLTLAGGGHTWVREVTTAGSYLSASDPTAHFGLGPLTRLDRLTIRWPSGKSTTLPNPPVDRILAVREEAR